MVDLYVLLLQTYSFSTKFRPKLRPISLPFRGGLYWINI